MEAQLKPLQNDATSGDGRTLIVPDFERIVRFLIRSKGSPTGGEIQIECCPMKAPGIERAIDYATCRACFRSGRSAF
jgi:hypothetical protein